MSIPTFPILFGESSHGKRKMWQVTVEERDGFGVVSTTHGYEDGKKVVNERVIETGKNLGRSNATTPVQQAISEARALWKKKCDAGYKPEGDPESDGSAEATTGAGIPLPMLAQDYNKRGKSIVFPCIAQPKLDGVRCVAVPGQGLFSRNAKAFPHLNHIREEVNRCSMILDGELYSDTLSFQEVVGLVKKQKLTTEDTAKMSQIYLAVYDIIGEGTNEERNVRLAELFATKPTWLRPVKSVECTKEDIGALHAAFVAEGYEGLMLRNKKGLYRNVRSTDLQKYKEFEDAEYKVVGFKEGDGLEKGCVIWICQTPKGQEFAVRPRGTHEERLALFAKASSYVGRPLTVRFQELTTDGIPRFPVGIAFRDYE